MTNQTLMLYCQKFQELAPSRFSFGDGDWGDGTRVWCLRDLPEGARTYRASIDGIHPANEGKMNDTCWEFIGPLLQEFKVRELRTPEGYADILDAAFLAVLCELTP